MDIKNIINSIIAQEVLSYEDTYQLMMGINEGKYTNIQIGSVLTALQMRGITADELLGFRAALLEVGVQVDLSPFQPIDIVGTGGDGKNTFNISTCSCFIVAGAGYKVAKHGSYAATSVSGASNVLEYHGVKFTADQDTLLTSLETCGFTYMHAPLFAKGMKNVAPVRGQLGIPTCFNLLGPLINPSRPHHQLLGVANLYQMRLYKQVMEKLGIHYGLINSLDGYDEVSLTGDFKVQFPYLEQVMSTTDLGLQPINPSEIYGGQTLAEAAAIFNHVLDGTASPAQQQVVCINAAYAIKVLSPQFSIDECIEKAYESVKSGNAKQCFIQYLTLNT